MIDVQRVDFVRVPARDIEQAADFYGRVLGLPLNPNSPGGDWLEFETGNVTLAVMTPETHGQEFVPLPHGALALRVPDVDAAKAALESEGVATGDVWDSGVCKGVTIRDPDGNPILLHHRYAPYPDGSRPDDQAY
jgi:catechol 2,3-dioxygenase-like lactoylglutathione lyase family enzyme